MRRARELRQAVTRVIWNEAETPDCAHEFVEEALDDLIIHDMRSDGFCARSLDDRVMSVCLELGLSPQDAARWRDLPEHPDDDDDEDKGDPGEPPVPLHSA